MFIDPTSILFFFFKQFSFKLSTHFISWIGRIKQKKSTLGIVLKKKKSKIQRDKSVLRNLAFGSNYYSYLIFYCNGLYCSKIKQDLETRLIVSYRVGTDWVWPSAHRPWSRGKLLLYFIVYALSDLIYTNFKINIKIIIYA